MSDLAAAVPDWRGLNLDEIAERIARLPKEIRDEIAGAAVEATAPLKWMPHAGPQQEAYFSKADILLYGGQAGGGKTSLILGLALTAHRRSLVMRQEYTELGYITGEAIKINGTRAGFNGSNPPSLRTADGRFIQFSGAKLETLEKSMGQPFDLKAFDEAVHFPEEVIRFHLGWLRTDDPNQRTRVVLGTNPPVNAQGDWIIPMFAPWLDITHPNPAKPGELRWFVRDPDGNDFETPGPEPYQFPGQDKPLMPMSRTFIPAALSDNPVYANDKNYIAALDSMPEPYRSALRDGNFMLSRADQDWQVIPTQWIIDAQKRWRNKRPEYQMTAMGIDVGAGGADRVVIAARYGEWYAPLIVKSGKDAPNGSAQAALIVQHRADGCGVVVDVGGGYGGDCVGRLKDNQIVATKFNGSAGSTQRALDGRVFLNERARAYWRFREALNPDQAGGSLVALPDDSELRSELAAICQIPDVAKIQVESKVEVKKRLGRSPDKADAVVMAWAPGQTAQRRVRFGGIGGADRPTHANVGYADLKRSFANGR
jgi:hypothetical protein